MKCSSFIRISGVWILAAGFSHAILDTNNNGLSDFWERDFNNGNVFDESFDPQADSDADGWANAQEAAAGTNPFDPNPPDGLIQPTTAHVPAVLGEENGVPVVITPEVITVSWPTLAGKQYTLLFSPGLTEESWLSVGAPFIAYGGEVTYYFEISQSDKCFWRVSVEDIDEDSDGLTHYEELVAGTNPTITDTDGDTLPDHAELIAGTDPMQADADGDGWTDPQELAAGTDSRNQDTDGDGIPDSIDSNPLVSALSFPDADGDGIPDAEDSAPNNSRGPAPSITSETTSGNPLSNLIKDETMKFVLMVSNPGGLAPTASNLTFFLNGTEKTTTITAIGDPISSSQRFLLTWTAETTANYPALTLQNLTLRFRDAQDATTWHKLARIDVAEWEGMMASLRTGTGATIPLLNIVSHSNGVKSRSFYYMSTGQSQAGWYRGSRAISFVDGSSGSPLLTAQIAVGMRYPLFIISDSSQGPLTLTETISISSPLEYTHHGELLLNNSANGVRSIYDPGGTNTALSGQRSYLALPERGNGGTGNTNIRKEIFRDGEWQLSTASTLPLYHADGTSRRIWSTRYYPAANPSGLDYKGMSLIAPVEAKIIPHAAGTLEYPGLPLPIDRDTDSQIHSTHPALLPIGQGAWLKIVLKAGPDAAALSNGIGLWLRKGESGADDPQTGFTVKVLGDNETLADLAVPADGKITLAADSANWQRLTSPQGLTLFLSKDETVTGIHDLSLQLLKRREWHPQESVKIVDVDLLPVEVSWNPIDGFDNVDDHIDPWTKPIYGKRIFPDFKNPDDTEIRHKLEVIVKTSPALAGKTVFVKSLDVDDSTSEDFDKDIESGAPIIDTNGKAGGDNLTDYLNTPKNGQFWTGSAWGGQTSQGVVDADGEAKFIFRVGMQPGNNYRVVASVIDESMYAGVQTSDPAAAKYLGPEPHQTGDAPATELLTVWRRLWVENDSMEAHVRNDLFSDKPDARIHHVWHNQITNHTSFLFEAPTDSGSFMNLQNGKIVTGNTTHEVLATGVATGQSVFGNVAGLVQNVGLGDDFRLYDDDDFGLNRAPLPRNDLIDNTFKNVYKPGFIDAVDAADFNGVDYNPDKEVDFYRNHPVMVGPWGLQTPGVWDDAINLTDSKPLWVGNLIAGYQGDVGNDGDPVSEGHMEGITPESRRYSIVYVENVRDQNDAVIRNPSADNTAMNSEIARNIKLTAAHEIGHMPGGEDETSHHAENMLMDEDGYGSDNGLNFSPKSILRFRKTNQWQQP